MTSSIHWTENKEQAFAKAAADEKPIFIDFFNPE
tara:strand:+ start:355 stop:456 length:102 start_codon:yes stop_codon:yes gene_type:complete